MTKKAYLSLPQISFQHIIATGTTATLLTIFAKEAACLYLIPLLYAIITGCALIWRNKNLAYAIGIASLFSLLALLRAHQQQTLFNRHQELLSKPVGITAIIKQVNRSTLTKEQTTLLVEIVEIEDQKTKAKTKVSSYVSIFTASTKTRWLQENQKIKIYNIKLEQPQQNKEYQRYLIKENIWAIGHCTHQKIYGYKLKSKSLAQQVRNLLHSSLNLKTNSLFEPLFLGKKSKSIDSLTTQHHCVQWGIAHHMARSGAHLGIIFALFMLLLHYLNLSHKIRYLICALTLTGYAFISYSSISFMRALIMILLLITSKALEHASSSLHIVTLTTLTIALYNPAQIFFLDFQLSFGITFIIIWLFHIKSRSTIALSAKGSIPL